MNNLHHPWTTWCLSWYLSWYLSWCLCCGTLFDWIELVWKHKSVYRTVKWKSQPHTYYPRMTVETLIGSVCEADDLTTFWLTLSSLTYTDVLVGVVFIRLCSTVCHHAVVYIYIYVYLIIHVLTYPNQGQIKKISERCSGLYSPHTNQSWSQHCCQHC